MSEFDTLAQRYADPEVALEYWKFREWQQRHAHIDATPMTKEEIQRRCYEGWRQHYLGLLDEEYRAFQRRMNEYPFDLPEALRWAFTMEDAFSELRATFNG